MAWLIFLLAFPQEESLETGLDPTAEAYVELARQSQRAQLAQAEARLKELKSQKISSSKERKRVRGEQTLLLQKIQKLKNGNTLPPAEFNVNDLQSGLVGVLVTHGFEKSGAALVRPNLMVDTVVDNQSVVGQMAGRTYLVKGINTTDVVANAIIPMTDVFVVEDPEGENSLIDNAKIVFVLRKFTAEGDIKKAWDRAKQNAANKK